MLPIVSAVVPVIDLKSNQVVHAIAGNRESYRPVTSRLVGSTAPGQVARAFADLGFRRVYVADLDAIEGAEPDWDAYHAIGSSGLHLWIDNGVQQPAFSEKLRDLGHRIIVGLEGIGNPQVIDEILSSAGAENVIVSIDMRSGMLVSNVPEWQDLSPLDVAEIMSEKGIGELILLDLALVGTESGISPSMSELIRQIRSRFPTTRVYSGGGIRTASDVQSMINIGCDAVLVSTALHNLDITV